MLTFCDKDVKKGQAIKHYDTLVLGHLEQDFNDISGSKRKLVSRECKDIIEVIGAVFTIDVYYNKVLFKENLHTYCDYYGFFESAKAIAESIEDMVETYDLENDKKFDIRVKLEIERKLFYRADGKLKEFDSTWFYNFKDASQYFEMADLSDDELSTELKELRATLDLSRPNNITDAIEVYTSLADGLRFTEDFYLNIKNQYLENGYTIKD